ncbi:hypothetical protein PVAR5_2272 [Paecilomyces variotii No. 5]|uniref:Uncharacterized protein n=1 Tax=Byssochlamys spectabilis (strain No. 5 / NBRC 109023) TaxID=1356009 RepID=V5FAX7_BYSSN|nr:hypothetical protein PVAR5_2272 [Paecilomyces variotii No. 5]
MTESSDLLPQGSPDSDRSPLVTENISILKASSSASHARRNTPITSTAAYAWLNVQKNLEYYQKLATRTAAADLKLAPSKDAVGQVEIESAEKAHENITKIA